MVEPIPPMTKKESTSEAGGNSDVLKKEEVEESKELQEQDLIFDEEVPDDPLVQNGKIDYPTAQELG